jgi:alkanesulfonate monooxygenase SsuD/methylene tetrahydromethanopterin reductase-like flavin-dependent oxidoreductase (luciferase family)
MLTQVPYRDLPADFGEKHISAVTTPYSLTRPEEIAASFKDALDQMMHAARKGFDGLAFTEHGQSIYDMAPNPSLIGSAVAYATEAEGLDTAICALGRSLGKSREPVRVAEEYAMIDAISNGRLLAGFPVGLAYDANLNNGVPPIDTRARFDENLPLVLRAWTEKEPFAHNGRFSQYPSVNIWPRPVQARPPVWMTGIGNPATMKFALENDFGFNYFGWFGVKSTGDRIFDRFWQVAEECGQERNPYRVGLMQTIVVGDSDAHAKELYGEHVETFFQKFLGGLPMEKLALPGQIGIPGLKAIMSDPGDFGLYLAMRTASYEDMVDAGCVIAGSADSVAEQLSEIATKYGIGHLLAMLQVGTMGRELTMENIDRFTEGVLPKLKDVFKDEGLDNHWWPERLGGKPNPIGETRALEAV